MRVLIACEYSGTVRREFLKLGHEVWSCDLLPSDDDSPFHIQCDVRELLTQKWDLMIAHPPCTYLAVSGLHWNKKFPERQKETEKALKFVSLLLNQKIPRIALENPVSCISSRIRKPDQIIQPWQFGHDASKKNLFVVKRSSSFKTNKDN